MKPSGSAPAKKTKTDLSCAFAQTVGIHSHAPCGESTSVSHMTFNVLYPVKSQIVNETKDKSAAIQ